MPKFLPLGFGLLLCATYAFGQFETSELLGTVKDASNAAVANVTVTLTNEGTGIVMCSIT